MGNLKRFVARLTVATILLLTVQRADCQNVIAWGNNTHGETDVPESATNIVQVAAGWHHSLALREDGTVVSWGAITNVPPEATNVIAIAAGAKHNFVLRSDGRTWAWGDNTFGQSQNYSTFDEVTHIATGEDFNVILHSKGKVYFWGKQRSQSAITNMVAISAARERIATVRPDGVVTNWGTESWGAFHPKEPPPLSLTNGIRLYAGYTNNITLRADGNITGWGTRARTHFSEALTNIVSLSLNTNFHLALRRDGTVGIWGNSIATNAPTFLTNVIAIAAGRTHGLAVIGDGTPKLIDRSPAYHDTVSASDPMPLTAQYVAKEPIQLQWYANGEPIPGATNAYPRIPACHGTDEVGYHYVVSNAFGSITSDVAKVKVLGVKVWGDNANKQRSVPGALTNAVAIAAGGFHGLALTADGTVAGWGRNRNGQCTIPRAATNVTAIAAGGEHSLALRADGKIIAWGRNSDGQTNVPVALTNALAIAAGSMHSVALRTDGRVVAWGNNDWGQTNVPPYLKDIIAVAAGYYHNLALRADGVVFGWGNEESLVPASATNVIAIAAGWNHNIALREDGRIITWGDNAYGQCDVPAQATNIVAVAAGYYHSAALRADGKVVAWGKGYFGVTNVPPDLGDVSCIAVGEDFSMALARRGAPVIAPLTSTMNAHAGGRALLMTSVGGTQPLSLQWYHEGEPIVGATNQFLALKDLQISNGGTYTLVVKNASGETNSYFVDLFIDATPYIFGAPVKQRTPPFAVTTVSASIHGMEPMTYQWLRNGTNLLDSDRIRGSNQRTLEINTTEYEDSGLYELAISNAVGSITGLVSELNVTPIVCWGDNSGGQLDAPLGASNIISVSGGGRHSLALREDGTVMAWGDNTYGQTTVPAAATNISAIAAGFTHSVGLRSNGTIVVWGDSRFGQSNPASLTNGMALAANMTTTYVLASNGTVYLSPSYYPSSALTGITAISASINSIMALRQNGTPISSRSPIPAGWTNLIAIAASGSGMLGLRADGTVLSRFYTQTNLNIYQTNAIAISAGDEHVVTLDVNGTVREWGTSDDGQPIFPQNAQKVIAINAGSYHTLALLQTNSNLHFTVSPTGRVALPGQSVSLDAEIRGRGPIGYQWYFENDPINGATNTNFAFSATVTSGGDYKLVATNPWSSITSVIAHVSVIAPPVILTHPQDQTLMPGQQVTFLVEVESQSPVSYQWRSMAEIIPGETGQSLYLAHLTPANSGIYDTVVANAAGSVTSAPARLLVMPASELNLGSSAGMPLLTFIANSNATYQVQYTTNLSLPIWIDLVTFSNHAGTYQLIDTNMSMDETRFYRTIGR